MQGYVARKGDIAGWRQLAEVAIIASLVVAACSLAVSVASSLIDRKRPFSLLRLTGTPLSVLDGVVGLEAALPLILVATTAAATGLLAAHLFFRSQLSESLKPPDVGYYIAVASGITFALGIIAATLPLLRVITAPTLRATSEPTTDAAASKRQRTSSGRPTARVAPRTPRDFRPQSRSRGSTLPGVPRARCSV